jgi:asparagine synthase (glutamine-hydrolysing)
VPGIVGIITRRPRDVAVPELLQMVGTLEHEDFYVSGTWAEESLGVYVGWVAREGSFSGAMPLENERRDVILAFSGEEFPEPGTPQRLKMRGHDCELDGSSYLVHFAEEDPAFLAGLNGRFHGVLVNRNRRTATLFNDRYGMHRLYYHESKDTFYFAAEAKAILAVRPDLRRMDPRSAGEFVACGAVLENRTIFEGIELLPPASAWEFSGGRLERRAAYFHPREWEEQEALDPESYYKELRGVFARNLPRYFTGRLRVGMSLTGGLDTRMVMAWRRPEPGTLPCYTYGGMLRDCRDVTVAREVARACGQPHQVIAVRKEFLEQFPRYVERATYLSDGCVDVGRAPDLYLSERAREVAPVRMTGLLGGEILRSVRSFKPEQPAPGLFSADFQRHIHAAGHTYAGVARAHPVTFAAFRQAPWYHQGVLGLEQTQVSVRTPFLDNDLIRTAYRAPVSALGSPAASLRLIADGNKALLRIPTDRGPIGTNGRFSPSHALLEFLFKAEYGYDLGMPQWLARVDHTLAPLRLERLFLGRHKVFHFRTWYRDALAGYVRELLLDSRSLSRSYIERRGLQAVVHGHLRGHRNYTAEIHKVITLELVHRALSNLGSPLCRSGAGLSLAGRGS